MPFAWHGVLLDQLLEPSVRSIGRYLPVVVLAGPPGSGRSTFLDAVDNRYRRVAPLARTATIVHQPNHVGALAPLLVEYDRKIDGRRWRRLAFPRTLLGIAAVQANIEDINPQSRRRKLLDALADKTGTRAMVGNVLAAALAAAGHAPAPAIADVVAALSLAPVTARGVLRRRAAARWFGPALGVPDHVDALVMLNDVAAGRLPELGSLGAPHVGWPNRTVGDVFVAAFLADLTAGFHGSPSGRGRRHNCLLLIDAGDAPAAEAFLLAMTRARAEAARRGTGPADPLVVVASFGTRTDATGPAVPSGVTNTVPGVGRTVPATLKAWWKTRGAGDGPAPWWFEVRMPAVRGAAEITTLTGTAPNPDDVRLVADVADGHPRISRALLDGLVDALRTKAASPLVDALLKQSLPRGANLRECLVTVAAAHDVTAESCRHALDVDDLPRDLEAFLADDLWVLRLDDAAPVLHPAIRCLLLHRLATRPADASYRWTEVHDRLGRRRAIAGDDPARLGREVLVRVHHLLAGYGASGGPAPWHRPNPEAESAPEPVHRLRTVVGVLDAALTRITEGPRSGRPTIEDWWAGLRFVTSAPQAVPSGDPQRDFVLVRDDVEAAGGEWSPLTRLVVTRWLGTNRLADPGRTLLAAGAQSCRDLAADPRLPEGGHERPFLIRRAIALEKEIE